MKKHRFNLELSEDQQLQLKALQQHTKAASFSEVIRRALDLYSTLIKETENGGSLIVIRNTGIIEHLIPF